MSQSILWKNCVLELELVNSKSEIVKFRENLEIRDTELNQIKIELEITKKSSENQDDLDKIKFELEETRQKLKTLENSESLLEQVKIILVFGHISNKFWSSP